MPSIDTNKHPNDPSTSTPEGASNDPSLVHPEQVDQVDQVARLKQLAAQRRATQTPASVQEASAKLVKAALENASDSDWGQVQ